MVPTHRWYIERTVWLIAGLVLLTFTALAALVDPRWVLGVIATGVASVTVALTGFCIVGNVLRLFGFTPMLGGPGAAPGDSTSCRPTAGSSSAGSISPSASISRSPPC